MQTRKRGCRVDDLRNGNFRIILFGLFAGAVQSQEINNIPLIDLEDINSKIEEAIKNAKNTSDLTSNDG